MDADCQVVGCVRKLKCNGLCGTHYAQALRGHVPGSVDRSVLRDKICSIEDCLEKQYAKDMCHFHWQRVRLYGEPGPVEHRRNRQRMKQGDWDRPITVKVCRVSWCETATRSGDLCERHRSLRRYRIKQALRNSWNLTDDDVRLIEDYEAIIVRDPCSYCGKISDNTVDHIVPTSRGGEFRWFNLTGACLSCNSAKRDLDLLSYLLRRLPV